MPTSNCCFPVAEKFAKVKIKIDKEKIKPAQNIAHRCDNIHKLSHVAQSQPSRVTSSREEEGGEGSPTNIASVHLVMDCPNAKAGAKNSGRKREPLEQPRATRSLTFVTNYH